MCTAVYNGAVLKILILPSSRYFHTTKNYFTNVTLLQIPSSSMNSSPYSEWYWERRTLRAWQGTTLDGTTKM